MTLGFYYVYQVARKNEPEPPLLLLLPWNRETLKA